MNKIKFYIFTFTSAFLVSGCGNNTENDTSTSTITIDINELAKKLTNNIEYTSVLERLEFDYIENFIELSQGTEAVMYMSNATCEEVAVFDTSGNGSTDTLIENITAFLSDQKETFKQYSPDDAKRIDEAIVKSYGDYVALCVCDTPDIAEYIIDNTFSANKASIHNAKSSSMPSSTTDMVTPTYNATDTPVQTSAPSDTPAPTSEPMEDTGSSYYTEIIVQDDLITYNNITVIGDTGYSFYGYSKENTQTYAQALNSIADELDKKTTIYSIPVPLSGGITFPDNYMEYSNEYDEEKGLANIEGMLSDKVKSVNLYDKLMLHRDEYIYYRTDHHWTALGAYYSYQKFCEVKGIEAEELDSYTKKVFEDFSGSYIQDTEDENLAGNLDTIYAYVPNCNNTMVVTPSDGDDYVWPVINDVSSYDNKYKYSTFIAGDNPMTVITNKDLKDGSSCIVIKDSFGNAFVPFLVDHYETIYVIDFRYWNGSVKNLALDNDVDDILVVLNICNTGNTYSVGKIKGLLQ